MSDQDKLLEDIKSSIMGMQDKMQSTYQNLSEKKVSGQSNDETVEITMYANYTFGDIEFDEKALKGGVKEFKWRIREAWKNVTEEIQKVTQAQTMELLQGMDVPEDIKQLSEKTD